MFDDTLVSYLEGTVIPIRLSCSTGTGWPVVLSLWFLYQDGYLYCATEEKAKVIEYLKQNPKCGFEVASDLPPYCGVRGRATAELIPEMGDQILRGLLVRYLGSLDSSLAKILLSPKRNEIAIRLNPVSFTTWDFSGRMRDAVADPVLKICP